MDPVRTDLTLVAAVLAAAIILAPAVLARRRRPGAWIAYAAVWVTIAAGVVALYGVFG